MARETPLWLADWSDSEDEDFRAAWRAASIDARVLRAAALGTTVGTRHHRLRSWPAYAGLAVRGIRKAEGAPLIAWQPLAGALAGLIDVRHLSRLTVLNPLLSERAQSRKQRLVLAGLRRADRVVLYTRSAREAAVRLGLDSSRTSFVPLGVRARVAQPAPSGDYFIAAGREERDWETLARAAEGLTAEIRVLGPARVPPPLRSYPQLERGRFLALLEGARALIVPLQPSDRAAGQLAVLDAMSVGRPVVATRAPGTLDYVSRETGVLVPPTDPAALRGAIELLFDDSVAKQMGQAALDAARGPFSLEQFVRAVDDVARAVP